MGELRVFGDVASELDEQQYQHGSFEDYPEMLLLEAPNAWKEAWVIDNVNGCLMSLEGLAAHRGESTEELRSQLRKIDTGDGGAGTGDGGTGGGDAGDIGVEMVPIDELDADLDQGTVRKSIRGLDQGAVEAIREVTGASSDAEAVRKAVALAKNALVED